MGSKSVFSPGEVIKPELVSSENLMRRDAHPEQEKNRGFIFNTIKRELLLGWQTHGPECTNSTQSELLA